MKPPGPHPPPLPAPIAHHSSLLLFKLAGWIQAEMDRVLEPRGLRTRHYSVLSVLEYQGPWSQLAVGQKLRIDKASMVGIVDDLERLGLVERQRNPQDRRHYSLRVTPAGHALIAEAERAVGELEDALFEPLSAAERRQLHASLERLLAPAE